MTADSQRPLATMVVLFYRQERYAAEAVAGALSQSYHPLEIIFSDDASPDQTFDIINESTQHYSGPHRLILNRNMKNLGLSAHVNSVLAMAKGEVVVMAAGDDVSRPSRVADSVAALIRYPNATAVSFIDRQIDQDGNILSTSDPRTSMFVVTASDYLAAGGFAQRKFRLSGASRALRRSVYETFGSLLEDCPAEDGPYILRALYMGDIVVCEWPGIDYRIHEHQLSSERSIVGMDPRLFRDQYSMDLVRAQRLGLVTRVAADRALIHFSDLQNSFRLRRLAYYNEKPGIDLLLSVLRSRQYSLREKMGLLRRSVIPKR